MSIPQTPTALIHVIAPALRGLTAPGSKQLNFVRFSEGNTNTEALQIKLDPEKDEVQVVDQLRAALGAHAAEGHGQPAAVHIKNLGSFTITEPPGNGRVAGKIALITGGAQGFGLEIAKCFIAAGGTVVLTDVNEQGAQEQARALCAQYGAERALGLAINVTDPESIAACIHQVVRTYGGCDLLLSNAGVLKAGSVKDLAPKDFAFVTAVNYTGYFLCTQQIAPILATQHRANPHYFSDIIQINSKSGLVGSNKNGAYAGSKFGGIGLTQSFALELISDAIKVNAICPGNFFDGPLWSDPANGLFVQYLKAGKVPGAKTVEDVKRSYEEKVPMGRGCRPMDVAKAIFYLMDQDYETGQALPVTGGQVMLA